ncbi:MAG: hypothetical protein GC149_07440 [Gammaproteobacteria bacterium]|nr:hypothetical protein [Gammaproteobacteria bacterium]
MNPVVSAADLQYTPYKDTATDTIYNLLFCDDLDLYRNNHKGPIEGTWQVLFSNPPEIKQLQALADDKSAESRLRILAFNRLIQQHVSIKQKELLGVIVEVGLDQGLDTLAAYKDMRVRYINRTGKLRVWEKHDPSIDAKIKKLFQEVQPIIEKIGPWDKARLPPPPAGQMRLTFLVSDGLYFGEGTMRSLGRSPLAGPVVTAATELLFELTRQ